MVSSVAPALAQAEFSVFTLLMTLTGGLALFLYGMEQLAEALQNVAGDRMRTVLASLTRNRFTGAMTGAFVTAVIQSSSVTTVLVVGFIGAGLMSLAQSVGIIMGANVGTTVTAQIIAFKITHYALLMIAVGFAVLFFAKRERVRHQGMGIMGLGLVFFGMSIMGEAMEPLRSYQPFLDWMIRMEQPFLGILAGATFTAVVQSSSATTAIVIVIASQGLISLPAGITLAFGANIGTCVTALLASIGRTRPALRAATVHVLFNVLGVLIWLPFVELLADLIVNISPSAPELTGTAKLAAETPRQIANAHTIFNLANTIIFIPFTVQFARIAERLVPDRPVSEVEWARAKYLDRELLATPSLALDRARLELLHLGDLVKDMLVDVLPAVIEGSKEDLDELAEKDERVDTIHGQIVTYLGRISTASLGDRESGELLDLMQAVNDLESIGDVIETNLVTLGRRRIAENVRISPETKGVLLEIHESVVSAFDASVQSVAQRQVEAARHVITMKKRINRLMESAALHQAKRLMAEEPNRLSTYSIEMDIIENLKRVFYFCKKMARAVRSAEVDVELD